ncbi:MULTISPECIES: hypothetical protein [Rhizobium]|uniref:PepSY domain-containing protein n=1 Tax=Rhizobium paranaense TaxID=1650438 RepID=A0A7W9D0C1_9HYPH|nr:MULTISPECIES: hypothetical protein [Rhizobium]MBB5573092.1 hypothetical protein [Rhizobium paranaense]PST62135.1 hypothetical protein C9E91_16310 [Rhizobium sp. SEMIA4064]
MTKWNGWSAARLLFPLVLLAPVTACVSSPPPDQMARTKLQTAPADLQLLCADAAAKSAGLTQNKVLPTNSQQLDATTYRVELNATGRRFNCIIDNTGKVASVQPVA